MGYKIIAHADTITLHRKLQKYILGNRKKGCINNSGGADNIHMK